MATPSRAAEHAPDHDHSTHSPHAHPAYAAGTPSRSLLRLSVWQRLAIVVPIGAGLWALALWVIWGGAS